MENGQEKPNDNSNGDIVDEGKNIEPTTNNSTKEITEEPTENLAEQLKQPLEEASEELLEKIRDQIEYYFGDLNMQKDKFLISQSKLNDGWIPMTVMLNFKQLAALSKNSDVILKALESSDLIEISEDKKSIRRSPKYPLPEYDEEYKKAQEARTVYVKGFPLTGMTMDKLKEFIKPYKPFEGIIMRKYLDNKDKVLKFKGSIYVLFKTVDDAKAFMEIESIKYEDTELIRKWSADYSIEKKAEKGEQRKKKDKLKNKVTRDEEETDQTSEEANSYKLPKGSVIYFSGVPNTCTRENIKACLDQYDADIAYIDFQRGLTEGWVRLQGENAAKPLIEKTNGGKLLIGDTEVTCKILDGEEENKYLTKVAEEIAASKNKFKSKRGGKKGRKGQGAKKRSGSPINTVPAKKTG